MVLDANVPEEPLRFILKSSDSAMVAQASSQKEKDEWIAKINVLLDIQKNMLAALQNPRNFMDAAGSDGGSGGLWSVNQSQTEMDHIAECCKRFAVPEHRIRRANRRCLVD